MNKHLLLKDKKRLRKAAALQNIMNELAVYLNFFSRNRQRTISKDLINCLIISVLVVSLLNIMSVFWIISRNSEKDFSAKLDEYADHLRETLKVALWHQDLRTIKSISDAFTKNDLVGKLIIYDESGPPITSYIKDNSADLLEKNLTIRHQDKVIGSVRIGLLTDSLQGDLRTILVSSIATILWVIVTMVIVTQMVIRRVFKTPISVLIRQIDLLADGETAGKLKTDKYPQQEIHKIIDRFNNMAEQVRHRENALVSMNQQLSLEIEERKKAEKERKKMETLFFKAQKMEALGTLAGGIAHDFNNILMGIQGRASLMLINRDLSDTQRTHLKEIEYHVKSASDLTRQILGFARSEKINVTAADISKLAAKCAKMFGRTHKDIKIHQKVDSQPCIAEVDKGQIEQVLLNIFVNAWQAMPSGGDLHIKTDRIYFDVNKVKPFGLVSGTFIKTAITDTGTGMDEDTRQKIFDPFFTTKGFGRGTGLGLSSAYAIIKKHGGFITVKSKPGNGTTFTIHLPASSKPPVRTANRKGKLMSGSDTILLVDDEKLVIDVLEEVLTTLGYDVLKVFSGEEAIEKYQNSGHTIHMVILDMIMPGMSGDKVFYKIKELDPDAKILISSGYNYDGQVDTLLANGCNGYISKPFSMEKLSQKMRDILKA